MEHRNLGATGLPVSRLVLGTATFGGQCDEATSHRILDRAVELGMTTLDTADKYPLGSGYKDAGVTEAIVGRWIESRRHEVVIATKVHGPTGPQPWERGLGRRHVVEAVDASLKRLRVEAIDLYQLHRPDPTTPILETLETLDGLVRAGKVRYVGCSNFLAYQLAQALGKSEAHRLVRFASVQPRYNLLFRQHERELLPLCAEEGLGVLTYNLLAGGMLTGKHSAASAPVPGSRFDSSDAAALYRERYWHDEAFDAVASLTIVAARLGVPLPELATAWVAAQPGVTAMVVGATRPEQLDTMVSGLGHTLDQDVLDELDRITRRFRWGDDVQ